MLHDFFSRKSNNVNNTPKNENQSAQGHYWLETFSKRVLTSKIYITDYTCKKRNGCELSFYPFFI